MTQPVARSAPTDVALLCVASPLFPEPAARALVTRTLDALAAVPGASAVSVAGPLARDRASLAEALAAIAREGTAGLVVQLSTFCTAELLHDLLAWIGPRPLPLALWALEEPGAIVTNSLCGAQLWASTLSRFGRRHALLLGDPEDARVAADLAAFAAAARAVARLRGARVALIGSHAEWFTNLAVDPWAIRAALDVTIEQKSLPAFIAGCVATPEAEAAAAARWQDAAFEAGEPEEGRRTLGRTFARLRAGLDRIAADAVAIRDWPEILYAEAFRGTWAALGALSDRPVPIAPEGDVMGALTALAVRAFDPASLPFLTDISGLDRAGNRLVLWHYGVSPRLAAGPRALDPVLKQESFPLKPGPLTLLRLSLRPDGRVRLFVAEGCVTAEPTGANRAAGYFVSDRLDAETLVRRFVDAAYEHHVTAVHGRWGSAARHMARQLGFEVDDA
jgi:L-fucose isomerase-like protein